VLQPNNRYPIKTIRIVSSCGSYFKAKTGGQWEQAISIEGIWGYVPHYEFCWQDTGYTVQNEDELSASDTELDPGDGNGASFSVGEYLQLEDETVFVTATDANSITIRRGQLGTTAAIHAEDTVISRYIHENIIKRACTEWAAYLFKTKDQLGQQVQVYDNGLSVAQGLSPTLYNALMKRQKVTAGSAG
jgi:hypothetical protein